MYVFCHLFLCTTTKIYSIPHKNFTLVIQVHTVPTASSDPSCTQSTLQFSANTIHVNEHYVCLRSVLITVSNVFYGTVQSSQCHHLPLCDRMEDCTLGSATLFPFSYLLQNSNNIVLCFSFFLFLFS